MCPALAQIPQLRLYLRPDGIINATEAQWAEELAPWETEYDKHGKPATLMGKFLNSYLTNRRNKQQKLQRISLLEEDADALGLTDACEQSVTLSHARPLSSVTNMVKFEECDPKKRAEAQARVEWLRALNPSSLTAVKSETGDSSASSTPTVSSAATTPAATTPAATTPAATTPATVQEVATAAAQAAVAALSSGAASTTMPPAGANGACQRPRIVSNLVPPTAPPANASTQLSTNKAVPSKEKHEAEKERSSKAAADQRVGARPLRWLLTRVTRRARTSTQRSR